MHPARAVISMVALSALNILSAMAEQPLAMAGHDATVPMGMGEHGHGASNSSNQLESFASAESLSRWGASAAVERDDDPILRGDTVFGHTSEGFHIFGEFLATSDSELDLERFQAGYEIDPDTLIWVGRSHQPASAWNTQHHHGQ